jgi:hypothetical protein
MAGGAVGAKLTGVPCPTQAQLVQFSGHRCEVASSGQPSRHSSQKTSEPRFVCWATVVAQKTASTMRANP